MVQQGEIVVKRSISMLEKEINQLLKDLEAISFYWWVWLFLNFVCLLTPCELKYG